MPDHHVDARAIAKRNRLSKITLWHGRPTDSADRVLAQNSTVVPSAVERFSFSFNRCSSRFIWSFAPIRVDGESTGMTQVSDRGRSAKGWRTSDRGEGIRRCLSRTFPLWTPGGWKHPSRGRPARRPGAFANVSAACQTPAERTTSKRRPIWDDFLAGRLRFDPITEELLPSVVDAMAPETTRSQFRQPLATVPNLREASPSLRADIAAITAAAAGLGDCRLIVIDPVSA